MTKRNGNGRANPSDCARENALKESGGTYVLEKMRKIRKFLESPKGKRTKFL